MTDVEKRQDRSPVPKDWTYAPAPESTDIVRLQERYGLFVGGDWLEAKEHFTTISPRDEAPLAQVAQGSEADVATAVGAARDAFTGWSKLPGAERAKYRPTSSNMPSRTGRRSRSEWPARSSRGTSRC